MHHANMITHFKNKPFNMFIIWNEKWQASKPPKKYIK